MHGYFIHLHFDIVATHKFVASYRVILLVVVVYWLAWFGPCKCVLWSLKLGVDTMRVEDPELGLIPFGRICSCTGGICVWLLDLNSFSMCHETI